MKWLKGSINQLPLMSSLQNSVNLLRVKIICLKYLNYNLMFKVFEIHITNLLKSRRIIYAFSCVLILIAFKSCIKLTSQQMDDPKISISDDLPWSQRMALSIMTRNDSLYKVDSRTEPKWDYVHGLVAMSMLEIWKSTNNKKYYDYAKGYADDLINESGEISGYNIVDFNIDNINAGKILFDLHKTSKEEKYKIAFTTLRNQLDWQPRNSQNGFWHKLRYPWQMWLDGLYMGAPFYARYAKENGQNDAFDDIANQFLLLNKYAKNKENGLFYHGWDESKLQKWADPNTGLSPHFWSRAIGWYAMALVDVLDYFPEDHPKRKELIGILNELMHSVSKFQNEKTGLWSQIMNLPDKEGNYEEATGSAMISYTMLKGYRKGYLGKSIFENGVKAYEGLIDNLIEVEENGVINLTKCCAVAGLGGEPYRDGSYDYYVNEQVKSNDPKGTGPFILASLEYEAAHKQIK